MNREKHLETILVLILALGVFYWIYNSAYILFAAGVLAFVGVFFPFFAEKIHWAWMKLAHYMGWFMSKVLLTVVYVVFLLPLAFFAKLFKSKNGVVLKRNSQSYFVERNFTYTKNSIENVW